MPLTHIPAYESSAINCSTKAAGGGSAVAVKFVGVGHRFED